MNTESSPHPGSGPPQARQIHGVVTGGTQCRMWGAAIIVVAGLVATAGGAALAVYSVMLWK